ncbi:MAG TPA: hypothetical protein VFM93_14100 [Candidatus Limnocylindria bacterium]|nr:hypothetical protein [Candidatus Limnocylindria bacterium]
MAARLGDDRIRLEIWTGVAVVLVLLASTVDAALAGLIALGLFALGLVLFPDLRRRGSVAAAVALIVAAILVLTRPG